MEPLQTGQPQSMQPMSPFLQPQKPRRTWWMFAVGFLVILALGIIANALWIQYFSPEAQEVNRMQKQYQDYEAWQQSYDNALKADTYGGKTPEETLALFIDALEKEDVDLASKYFMIDTELSRQKWIDMLTKLKTDGNMKRFAEDLKNKAIKGNSINKNDAGFVLLNIDGTVGLQIDLKLNEQTQIWKIESL